MAKKPSKKKVKRQVASGRAYIHASYNNTIVTITDPDGNPITWSSGGVIGYKGSRKGTPYAAQLAALDAAKKAMAYGMQSVSGAGHKGPPGLRPPGEVHRGRHPRPPQRLQAQEEVP